MEPSGVPIVRGYHGENQDPEFLMQQARDIGFPVLIKAGSTRVWGEGGESGGKGTERQRQRQKTKTKGKDRESVCVCPAD